LSGSSRTAATNTLSIIGGRGNMTTSESGSRGRLDDFQRRLSQSTVNDPSSDELPVDDHVWAFTIEGRIRKREKKMNMVDLNMTDR
jgi:hypothetical protein